MIIEGSSNIAEVDYNESNHSLRVKFHSGGEYIYDAVPRKIYDNLLLVESKGSYFYKNIRNKYQAHRVNINLKG